MRVREPKFAVCEMLMRVARLQNATMQPSYLRGLIFRPSYLRGVILELHIYEVQAQYLDFVFFYGFSLVRVCAEESPYIFLQFDIAPHAIPIYINDILGLEHLRPLYFSAVLT